VFGSSNLNHTATYGRRLAQRASQCPFLRLAFPSYEMHCWHLAEPNEANKKTEALTEPVPDLIPRTDVSEIGNHRDFQQIDLVRRMTRVISAVVRNASVLVTLILFKF
jgi:hypothetical protein